MNIEPQREHQWLHQLVGDWTFEVEAAPEPGQDPETYKGSESVRSLGGLWVIVEGRGEMPGSGEAETLMTLGYDPGQELFVGTFIASMMNNLWLYEGELDETGRVLTLSTEGPGMTGDGSTASYRDVIEIVGNDERMMTSNMLRDDGTWVQFMVARYRRRS